MWISDGSGAIKLGDDGLITTEAHKSGDKHYNALWVDGDGVNSGEHYWIFQFGDLSDRYTAVGLSSTELFGPGYTLKGLMYGGNLHNGGALLVMRFGPGISSNDRVGILASYTEEPGRLRIYLYQNEKPLGLAFDVDAIVLPNAHPVIRFSGVGSTRIRKEVDNIPGPENRSREVSQNVGIEGSWRLQKDSVQVDGKGVSEAQGVHCLDWVVLKIKGSSGSQYDVSLKVINTISFTVEKTESGWKGDPERTTTTLVGSSSENLKFEKDLTALCLHPENVSSDSSGSQFMTVRGTSKATFARFDDTPRPYTGDPFY